jgi:hypothetical protein
VSRIDDATIAAIDEIAQAIALQVARTADARAIGRSVVDRLRSEHGTKPVRAWLTDIGAVGTPPFEEWAAVSWPYLQTILSSPECQAFLDRLAREALGD